MVHLPCSSMQSGLHISWVIDMISSASCSFKWRKKEVRQNVRSQSIKGPGSGVIRGCKEIDCTSKPDDSSNWDRKPELSTNRSIKAPAMSTYWFVFVSGWKIPGVELRSVITSTTDGLIQRRTNAYSRMATRNISGAQNSEVPETIQYLPMQFIKPPISTTNRPPGFNIFLALSRTPRGLDLHQCKAALENTASKSARWFAFHSGGNCRSWTSLWNTDSKPLFLHWLTCKNKNIAYPSDPYKSHHARAVIDSRNKPITSDSLSDF